MDLSRYVKAGSTRSVAAGEKIFAEGDAGDVMYIIISGRVELRAPGGANITVEAGEPFGEMAIIDKGPRSATAVALIDSELAAINQSTFLVLVQDTPYFALEMMQALSERVRIANARP
ncbi:MAG TPA: cyclic nucleotide-binding domain-containing protein [Acidimicrobiales bacterium]